MSLFSRLTRASVVASVYFCGPAVLPAQTTPTNPPTIDPLAAAFALQAQSFNPIMARYNQTLMQQQMQNGFSMLMGGLAAGPTYSTSAPARTTSTPFMGEGITPDVEADIRRNLQGGLVPPALSAYGSNAGTGAMVSGAAESVRDPVLERIARGRPALSPNSRFRGVRKTPIQWCLETGGCDISGGSKKTEEPPPGF